MPRLEVSDLVHYCVVWEKTGDSRNGEPIIKPGVQHRCRWVSRRSQTTDPQSNVIATDADLAIDCCVPKGSIIWKGRLDQIPGTADPTVPTEDLYIVVGSSTAEDIKGRSVRYDLKLRRHNDSMPTIYDEFDL